MNENLDLVEILKDCPTGTKLYSAIHGEVEFNRVSDVYKDYPIVVNRANNDVTKYARDGRFDIRHEGECVLFPSKNQRDWSKFKMPVKKFNYDTLQPFDKVLVRDSDNSFWKCNFLSQMFNHIAYCVGSYWDQMIPYNDETKHLIGTTDMPDKKYIWWKN